MAGRLLACVSVAWAGHSEMFSCRSRGKECGVRELTDGNWATELGKGPHFVMFYAPWCGHCKMLAPKLKQAGKELAASGVAVGAVDVEPNGRVQSMFSDIRGFPTLKFVKEGSNPSKSAIDYNGPREAADIVAWSKEQATKAGVALVEPVAEKKYSELYTFLGRAALDDKPALLLVGDKAEAPEWFNGLHASLVATPEKDGEAETKRLIAEARKATKIASAKEALDDVAQLIDAAQGASKTPLFASAYCADAETKAAFGGSGLVKLSLDRKNLWKSTFARLELGRKIDKKELDSWARTAETSAVVPEFPKPASVLAAEERKRPKLSLVDSKSKLHSSCYSKANCVVAIGVDEPLDTLVATFSKNNMHFVSLAADAPVADALLGSEASAPALVLIKTGKRPRAARATGTLADFTRLLDDVLAGGAKFSPFPDKTLPDWPDDDDDDRDLAFDEDEL